MSKKVQAHDFIELTYTGRLVDGTVFDTTEKTVAEQNNLPTENLEFTTQIVCVGEKQVIPGLDEALVGKEINAEYEINLPSEQAFGKRDIKKLKVIPQSTFTEHQIQPQPGLQIDIDGQLGIVTRISGGRIIVNFNHPLAGREVVYTYKILRKITEVREKVLAFISNTLKIPATKITVTVDNNKAELTLPAELPVILTNLLTKKLTEVTGITEVIFRKLEQKNE